MNKIKIKMPPLSDKSGNLSNKEIKNFFKTLKKCLEDHKENKTAE